MNSFIPVLLAVLLAEYGGRMTQLMQLRRLLLAATLLGLAVGIAAFAGVSLAPTMTPHARMLLVGLALFLTGCSQFAKPLAGEPPSSIAGTLMFVWKSGAPFLAFAFSVWRAAPVAAAAGALAGIAGAVALGALAPPSTRLRQIAGIFLTSVGALAIIWALRLI